MPHLKHQFKPPSLKKLALLISATAASMQAQAFVLQEEMSISLDAAYASNPSMAIDNKQSVILFTATPKYSISTVEDQDKLRFDVGLNIQRSTNKKVSNDRLDPNLRLAWDRELERGTIGAYAGYSRASTRVSELTRSGLIEKDGSASSFQLGMNWSRLLTDKLTMTLGADYQKNDYSTSSLSDYSTIALNSKVSYEMNEYVSPFVGAGWTSYNSSGAKNAASNAQNYLLGTDIKLNPQLKLSLSTGFNHQSSGANGWIASSSLAYTGERYSLTGILGRSVAASGIGGFQESDQFGLNYNYALSDTSAMGSDFSWLTNRSNFNSQTMQLTGFYDKNLTQALQMRVTAGTSQLKGSGQNANNNLLGITLIYNFPEYNVPKISQLKNILWPQITN